MGPNQGKSALRSEMAGERASANDIMMISHFFALRGAFNSSVSGAPFGGVFLGPDFPIEAKKKKLGIFPDQIRFSVV